MQHGFPSVLAMARASSRVRMTTPITRLRIPNWSCLSISWITSTMYPTLGTRTSKSAGMFGSPTKVGEKPSVAGPYVEAGAQRMGSEVFAVNQIDPVIDVEILVPVVDGHVGVAGSVD